MQILAVLAAMAGLLSNASPPPGGDGGPVQIEAPHASYDVAAGLYRLEGGATITRGLVKLRSRTATYDPATGAVDAVGDALLTDASRVLAADGIHAVLDGPFEASNVVVFQKPAGTDLSKVAHLSDAATCGRNLVTARGRAASGTEGGPLTLSGAVVTPCDCPSRGPPPWEIHASQAVIEPGKRVNLSWPVLYVTPPFLPPDASIPIFAAPWLSLPLRHRESGLLFPEVGSSGGTGLMLGEPVFLTLGESADLTVTPRYAFGPPPGQSLAGLPSVRGPGGSVELRWAPWTGAAGLIRFDGLWDVQDEANPALGAPGVKGLRADVIGTHDQRFDDRDELHADLDLVGDPLYLRDFSPDYFQQWATSTRSAAVLSRRGDDAVLEVSAAYLEPVAPSGALDQLWSGPFGSRLPGFQEWPSLAATLAPVDLGGPLRLSGRIGLSRYAPIQGVTSDGGASGIGPADVGFTRNLADPTQLDGRWQPGERLAVSRLDGRVEVAAPVLLGGALSVVPFLRGAALGYLFDAAQPPAADLWGVGGVEVSTELSRDYGDLRHTIEPRLEWRYGTAVQGAALPAFAYDGWDRAPATPAGTGAAFLSPRLAAAAPDGVYQQARLALSTRLSRAGVELLQAEVGQEIDVGRGRLAETYLDARGGAGSFGGEAQIRFWPTGRLLPAPPTPLHSWLDAFSELHLQGHAADPRGDDLHLGLLAFGSGGSGQLVEGVDDLFDPRAANLQAIASGTTGTTLRFGPATVVYDIMVPVRPIEVPSCSGAGTRTLGASHVQVQTATVTWDSPCQCFRLHATVFLNDCGQFGYSMSVDLGRPAALPPE